MASAIDERRPILAGDLSQFSVQSLMAAFSLGRQVVTIEVLDAGGVCDARIVMKAGRVLSASAAGHTGTAAVQHLLASAVPARFRVVRETSDAFVRVPHITTLAEVTGASAAARRFPALVAEPLASAPGSRAEPPASALGARTRVMEGSLSDFDVATILQVVSTGRQHTALEVLTPQGVRAGSIQLKAGKVLSAETGSLRGVVAVRQLLSAPDSFRFAVFRAQSPSGALPLLGAVDEVLLQAASEEPARPWPRPPLQLAPPPSPADLEPDPDEIETLIPPPGAPSVALDAELQDAVDDTWDELDEEVTRVSEQRSLRPAALAAIPGSAPAVAAPKPEDAVPVLEGRLTDFDLSSVIQVAGLSRQPTAVLIFDDQRQLIGDIRVHAGQLLSVQALGRRDQAALRFLLHTPRDFSFSVWRQPGPLDPTLAPLGSVSELLQRATAYALAGPTLTGTEDVLRFRSQAPSVPANAPAAQTWKRALGIGLMVGLAVGVAAGFRPGRDSASDPASVRAAAAPAASAPPPVASAPAPVASPVPAVHSQAVGAAASAPVPVASALPPVLPSPKPLAQPVRPLARRRLALRSRAEIASIQGALKLLNCHPGPIDGVIGSLTRTAIATFQFSEGLPSDGELTAETEQRLQARMRVSDDPRTQRRKPQARPPE